MALASSLNPSWHDPGDAPPYPAITITATTDAGGVVHFFEGPTYLGSQELYNGEAPLTLSNLAVGDHTITAYLYYQNSPYEQPGVVTATLTQTVYANNTTVSLSADSGTSYHNDVVAFTATVTPSGTPLTYTPTGSVDFYASGEYLFSAELDENGTATVEIGSLNRGSLTVTAVYTGDEVYEGGAGSLSHTVLNNAPDVWADAISTRVGVAIPVGVLKNDYDPDGDTLTVTGLTQPTYGSVTLVDGVVTYTPAAGFTGTDSRSPTPSRTGTAGRSPRP